MEIHPVDIIISIINIVVLFLILRALLWKYVIGYLSERSARIQKDIDDAQKARQEAAAIESDCNQKISHLEDKGQEIILESKRLAGEESERIVSDAKDKASRLIREAEARIEQEKKQAIIDSNEEIAQLAAEMAASILEREISPSDNARAVDEFFSEVDNQNG